MEKDTIRVPDDNEHEYLKRLSREYTIPCANCKVFGYCTGRCDRLVAWKRKMLGLDNDAADNKAL